MECTNKVVYIQGKLYKILRTYEGTEDFSYHGSTWYETFIEAQDLETDEIKTFGDQSYTWYPAINYIKKLENTLEAVKKALI